MMHTQKYMTIAKNISCEDFRVHNLGKCTGINRRKEENDIGYQFQYAFS